MLRDPGVDPVPSGAASHPLPEQRERALTAWDAFTASAHRALDTPGGPDAPTRLPGWSVRDVLAHLVSWPEEPLLARVLAEAHDERPVHRLPLDQDAVNQAVVHRHRRASATQLHAALADGRARLSAAYDAVAAEPALGLAPTGSQVGPVPLLTQLGALAYELAVHAVDLATEHPGAAPTAGALPDPELLDAGLLALADITGALAARHRLHAGATLHTPAAGWSFTAHGPGGGWTVCATGPGRARGPAVQARSTVVLLDASAGRRAVPGLLARRDLTLRGLPGLLALAPLLDHVPGLPGGPALRAAAGLLGGFGRILGR